MASSHFSKSVKNVIPHLIVDAAPITLLLMESLIIPCVGNPDFVLYPNSKILIQTDDVLPARLVEYINDTMGDILKASLNAELRFLDIDCAEPTSTLKALYSRYSLFRYVHKYFVIQEEHENLSWEAIKSLAEKNNISLHDSILRLSVYPKAKTPHIVETVIDRDIRLSPTTCTQILSIICLNSNGNAERKYLIGFAPAESGLNHEAAFQALQNLNVISRAFYKIQEACERCDVKEWPQPTWNALDIGASPGGWSLYLSQVVGKVFAVDPAELVIQKPNVIHIKSTLQEALPQFENIQLHVVVCDMNGFTDLSVQCLASVESKLAIGGRIIWTLKYPRRSVANIENRLKHDVAEFHKHLPSCDVLKVMHMVSNHHERTLVAIKVRETQVEQTSQN